MSEIAEVASRPGMQELAKVLKFDIVGRITDADTVTQALEAFPDLERIEVVLDSIGGDAEATRRIYEALRDHKAHKTVTLGRRCHSGAATILLAGDTRRAYRDSEIAIHAPGYSPTGPCHLTAARLRRLAEDVQNTHNWLLNLYTINPTDQPFFMRALANPAPTYIDLQQAVSLGWLHSILPEDAPEPVKKPEANA